MKSSRISAALLALCLLALQGTGAWAQETCSSHDGCAATEYCRGIDHQDSCPVSSICEAKPGEGEQCNIFSRYCRFHACAEASLTCVPGISRCLDVGAACNTDAECGASQYCSKCFSTASGSGFCVRLPIEGEMCQRNCAASTCADGFVCGGDKVCHDEGTATTTTTTTPVPATTVPDYYCANRPCAYDATTPCQCDPACPDYGDCCADFIEQCTEQPTGTAPPPTTVAATTTTATTTTTTTTTTAGPTAGTTVPDYYCANRPCSYDATTPCQCDDACEGYGDCCPDYGAACADTGGSTPAGPTTSAAAATTADPTTTGGVPDYYCSERPCSYDDTYPCQCDPACADYGDCCPDHETACPDPAPA